MIQSIRTAAAIVLAFAATAAAGAADPTPSGIAVPRGIVIPIMAGDLAEGHYDTQSNQTKRTFTTNVCGAISSSPTRK
jgi:hypothetical protein